MQEIDTLLEAAWIIPVEPDDTILKNCSIAIEKGRIVEILPADQALEKYLPKTHLHYPDHVLTPGFVNAHTHSPMCLLRGLADDLPLMQWLQEHIWPTESRHVNEEFIKDGTQLAIAEMLRSGTTCFNDMYFYPDITGRIAIDAGMRAAVGLIVLDFPSVWAGNADEYINKGLEVNDHFRDQDLVSTCFAPHAPYTVSDAPLQHLQVLADELEIPVHMHVHETTDEIEQSLAACKMRPIERLNQLGLLSPNLIAVHMTHLQPDEIELIAESGVHVVHCPESNMKLASGFCQVDQLIKHGVNVALGTDGAASNNDLDMLSEMKTAALLAKAVANDATALPGPQALKMATLNGAKALGMDNIIGSLLPGKAADIIAIDLNSIETRPVYNTISQLAYSCSRDKITDVWVNGQHLLNQRQLTHLDQNEILEKTEQWQQRIQTS